MLYSLVKPLLFTLPPEKAHDLTLKMARLSPTLGKLSGIEKSDRLEINVGSCKWSFPVGLAAGLDKNGEALAFFSNQGFGALECGTITLRAQSGNPKPRMHRYPEEESLRNSMGFPNHGLQTIWPRLRNFEGLCVLGANIGKNKESNREESIEELSLLYETMHPFVDYFVINVSSPNTPGLRGFQEKSYLDELFEELNNHGIKKDLYLKISPDIDEEKTKELLRVAQDNKLTGLIATNTTIMPERGVGGISGKLLSKQASKIHTALLSEAEDLEIIGVGGMSGPQDIFNFWKQGGKAIQVYTSYVFQGPALLQRFKKEMIGFLDHQEIYSLKEFFALPLKDRQRRIDDYLSSR
jgi:dihydroorotate dehydrogenase